MYLKTWCIGPMQESTITSPYVHSIVDTNTFTMGQSRPNPMPELTLSPRQRLWIWTLVSWASLSEHCDGSHEIDSHFFEFFLSNQY
jgi:hypothetical protein